jgi:hypothetical protein
MDWENASRVAEVPAGMWTVASTDNPEWVHWTMLFGPSGGGRSEVASQAENEAADLTVKPPVATKEYAKDLGDGEDELSVGRAQQKVFGHERAVGAS